MYTPSPHHTSPRRAPIKGRRVCASALLLLFLAVGCGELGADGELRMREVGSQYTGVLRPIAEGYEVRYELLTAAQRAVDATHAETDDDSVLSIEIDDGQLRVTGETAGSAFLTAHAEGGQTDRFPLSVVPVADVLFELTRSDSTRRSWGNFTLGDQLNVLPEESFDADARGFLGDNARQLSGSGGSIPLEATNTDGCFSTLNIREAGYQTLLTATDAACEAALTHTGLDMALTFRPAPADDYTPTSIVLGTASVWLTGSVRVHDDTLYARPGATIGLTLHPADDDGFLYVGAYPVAGTIEVDDAEAFRARLPSPLTEDGETNQCVERQGDVCGHWTGVEALRLTLTLPEEAGETKVRFATGDAERTFTVVVDRLEVPL